MRWLWTTGLHSVSRERFALFGKYWGKTEIQWLQLSWTVLHILTWTHTHCEWTHFRWSCCVQQVLIAHQNIFLLIHRIADKAVGHLDWGRLDGSIEDRRGRVKPCTGYVKRNILEMSASHIFVLISTSCTQVDFYLTGPPVHTPMNLSWVER